MKNYLNKHHCNHRSECRPDPVIAVQGRPRRNRKSLSCFMNGVISQLEQLGKERTCEAYRAARNSFLSFTGRDVLLSDIDSDLMMLYEAHLRRRGVTANTSSFYMRILRAVCNRAAEQGLMGACTAFRHVYTGVDKTVKRAVSLDTVRSLKELPLRRGSSGELARDMFLFSFYTRGMSFVDMAYLRKSDLHDTEFSYTRRKTGQRLSVRWEQCMQEVVDKYNTYDSPYLLPLIRYEGKDNAKILESDGVLLGTNKEMIDSFNCQCLLNPKIKQPLGHIARSFKPEDAPRLTDEFMTKIALEYMELMGIKNTQFLLVRHHNTDNPHCHLVYNRIDYNSKVISSQNDFKRNEIATKKLKDKYGLTYAEDKSKTNVNKLHDPERVKYEIHNAVKAALKRSRTWWDLGNQLQKQGIGMTFKINRRTGKNEGLSFTKDGYTFKASDVSRQFSYSKLNAHLSWDMPKKQTEIEPKQQPIRQEVEQHYSVTESLIESNGLGLFTPSDAPPEDEQVPSWQKQKKKERKKNRGIRF